MKYIFNMDNEFYVTVPGGNRKEAEHLAREIYPEVERVGFVREARLWNYHNSVVTGEINRKE